jgi:RHS repeat-associated protein
MTDVDGSIVWQATYKAWGEVETFSVNEVEQNLRFQGQYFDDETGLHYNTFRYYDPGVGRFITQDPIGLDGGNNLYEYVKNPTIWVDPLGWCSSALGRNMGARTGDGMANHHLIPEELMKAPAYSQMFKKLKSMGFNGDGASNGIFLSGKSELAKQINLPGHWSSHPAYTKAINSELASLNSAFKASRLSDSQLALGTGKIQQAAREGLENGKYAIDTITGRLL